MRKIKWPLKQPRLWWCKSCDFKYELKDFRGGSKECKSCKKKVKRASKSDRTQNMRMKAAKGVAEKARIDEEGTEGGRELRGGRSGN